MDAITSYLRVLSILVSASYSAARAFVKSLLADLGFTFSSVTPGKAEPVASYIEPGVQLRYQLRKLAKGVPDKDIKKNLFKLCDDLRDAYGPCIVQCCE